MIAFPLSITKPHESEGYFISDINCNLFEDKVFNQLLILKKLKLDKQNNSYMIWQVSKNLFIFYLF